MDIGGTINGLLVGPDGSIFLSSVDGNPSAALVDTEDPTFFHRVKKLAPTGALLAEVDLSRQDSSQGPAVTPHQMTVHNDQLWVAIEGSELALALELGTLEELQRIDAPGLPRAIFSDGEELYAHGSQGFELHNLTSGQRFELSADPRPSSAALGQRCSCHPERAMVPTMLATAVTLTLKEMVASESWSIRGLGAIRDFSGWYISSTGQVASTLASVRL